MNTWMWVGVLVGSVFATWWGATRMAALLRVLQRRWGLTEAAGASFIAIATASPEIGVNLAAALRGAGDIGLGNMLGANIVPIPLVLAVAFLASWRRGDREDNEGGKELLVLQPAAVRVHAWPYVGIVLLVALLTVPAPWRGLQPVDAWIMIAAYLAYAGQAVLRGREEGEEVEWSTRQVVLALGGAVVLAGAAYAIVVATEQLIDAWGIPGVVGGLFITAPMSVIPEAFATWIVVRQGQQTTAGTGMIADNAVTLTLAFAPLGFVSVVIQDLTLFLVNLGFVLLMPLAYIGLASLGTRRLGFALPQVLAMIGLYAGYVALMFLVVL